MLFTHIVYDEFREANRFGMEFLKALEQIRTPFLNAFFQFWTLFGEELLLLTLLCIVYWCVNKELVYRCGLAYFGSGLAAQALKIAFRIERPWVLDPTFKPVEGAIETATGYSFPSGHSQGAAAVFATAGLFFKKPWVKLICFVIFPMVALSRMYLGVHTFNDVGVGLLCGLLFAIIAQFLLKKELTPKQNLTVAVVLALLSVCTAVYAGLMYQRGIIEYHYVADCCKSAAAGLGFAVCWYVERVYIKFDTHCDRWWKHVLKVLIGIVGVLVIKEGFKIVFGETLIVDISRYFLMIIWGMLVFPIVIKRMFQKV